jgi:uncharacterized protein with von Willebrand factor type A (vWA) domain
MSFRYSRWDGTQVDSLDADEVLDQLTDELMDSGDLSHALQQLYRWGSEQMPGLEQVLRQLRERREAELGRYDLDSTVDQLRERLHDVVETERDGIDRKVREAPEPGRTVTERMARQRRDQLDRLPEDLGGRVKSLREYDFMDPAARQKFEQLLDELQRQILDRMFQGMKGAIKGLKGEDLGRVREMVRDLNRMLEERMQGRQPDFKSFRDRFGDMFPPGIRTLDELLEHLQRQMAQMQSLLRSLSPEARQELRRLMDELLQDDSLRLELARLGSLMDALLPPSELTERYPFFGDEPLGMQEAMNLMGRLQDMDRLESQLERGSFRLDDVDRGLAEDLLGPDARTAIDRLRQLTASLEKAGYVERRDRRLELTPRGLRRLGQNALREVFSQLRKNRFGQHQMHRAGVGIEAGEDVKAYEYGDPFLMDMKETLFNSLQREGRGVPVRVEPPDFIVRRTEHSTQASTVLMIDMSRSMFLRGCFLAAKKVAIALDALIRSQYPRDSLYVVGFSNHAVQLKPQSLPQISLNDYVYGTNMQHGFQLARQLLGRHRGNRQVVMVTDGEPTAHLDNGHVYFAYPPSYRTIQETLREVQRCTRDRIVINTFMLDRSQHLSEFVGHMTRINKGRAFYVSPDRLGEYVLVDYVARRSPRRTASRA